MSVGCGRLAEGKGHESDWSRKFAHFVLFHPIKKRSFNLLCVLNHSNGEEHRVVFSLLMWLFPTPVVAPCSPMLSSSQSPFCIETSPLEAGNDSENI